MLTIDYGFTRAESVRFPAGTLMGYRRHTAREDVLTDPGERDITAHVNFTALEETRRAHAVSRPSASRRWRRRCSPPESAISSPPRWRAGAADELRRRMQLKTLLFGMGETFRVLLQRKRRRE